MKKEIYSVNCPKHIQFGDPMYFECFEGEKLSRLVADYSPPENFEARVVLEENGVEDSKMIFYLALKGTINTYLDGYKYKVQEQKGKGIGVDTAAYLLIIDGKEEEISTGADGYWGDCQEFSHTHKGKEILDAVIITVYMPEFENLTDMRGRMHYFFTGVCQIDGSEECTGHQIK